MTAGQTIKVKELHERVSEVNKVITTISNIPDTERPINDSESFGSSGNQI